MEHKEKSKKPVNPFFKWRADNIEEIKRANPKATAKQLQSIVSEAWKKHNEIDNQKMKETYSKELGEYAANCEGEEPSEKKEKLRSRVKEDDPDVKTDGKRMKRIAQDTSSETLKESSKNKPMKNAQKGGRRGQPM
jgi:hypothetical protein